MKIFWRFMTEERPDAEPDSELPLQTLSRSQLDALSDDQVHLVKLGHSSILLKIHGSYWLIDPVFSERASPFSFLGPKRFQPTPISINELPAIDRVLISHNHYDHLDKKAIAVLAPKVDVFAVPLGVDKSLRDWGVSEDKIQTFDWWDTFSTPVTEVTFAPTQHFSGRGLGDSNESLWGSWIIKTRSASLYFSGDSGYFSGFKTIGERLGPFDLTMIETGAYDEQWPGVHMRPAESVQAHIDLQGKVMMPIHNGTFNLAFHAWYDPLDTVADEADKQSVTLTTPIVGEIMTLGEPWPQNRWWLSYKDK
ncbi:MBL fold metallo-hydrolase [Gilvimarinus xylanilyticus]|uniref:MBL fold metallo-hydrolase n=1 Tax=Gilvimarinus xylanilyticus TaxID=2944139 RepID=A0A9X2I405_9GAMM|nr:MBL fold metallo-hydrolase [Gilvimarinus xylanilyticus]